ncbi:hypothetical protein, partial [Bacillus mycoides]|uniref:hypothetical protein n=1 Tax=Bacillus mycoides TaxID=1405 RepID=UPI003A80C7F6
THVVTVELGKKGWTVYAGVENEGQFWSFPCPSPAIGMVRIGLTLLLIGVYGTDEDKKEADDRINRVVDKVKSKTAILH